MKHSLLGGLFIVCIFFLSLLTFAEGTKQFRPLEIHKGELCIDTTRNKFGSVSATVDYRLYIHISDFNNEAIYFGFGQTKHNGGLATFRLYRPDGTIDTSGPVPTATGSRGYIDTYSNAVIGPTAVAGPTGYWALRCTPDMNGDYYIAFKITWQTGFGVDSYKTFANFDVTVVNTTTWDPIDGRLWSKAWQLYAEAPSQGSGNQYWGNMFIYSVDSIITKVNLNGMIPGTFTISCNESGCYPIGPTYPLIVARKSVSGEHTYPQYKIFLNDPDNIAYPSGTLGGLDNNIPVTTQKYCDGKIDFTFGCTKAGNIEIHLLLSGLGPPYTDRTIPAQVVNGVNTIQWDGLDGNGLPIPNGATFQFYISYVNGLTHLPLYDVEFNANGFQLDLVRPLSIPLPPAPLFYWDDTNIAGGSANFTGCLSIPALGCHIWNSGGGGFGNNRTINTWWYAVSTSTANVVISEQRAPGFLGSITGTISLCPGATNVQYTVPTEVNSTSYQWAYSGTGATITNNGNNVITIDFSVIATSGTLSVQGFNNECGLSGIPSNLTITMQPFPPVVLNPFPSVCINTPAFILTGGSPAGGTYYVSGNPTSIFNPSLMGIGSHTITYYYSDPTTSCSKSVDQPIAVLALPVVTLQPFASVCSYVPPFILSGGNPVGGIFAGIGVSGGIFDPSAAGPGTWTITYTYTDPTSCVTSTTQNITVFSPPVVSLAPFASVCVTGLPLVLSGGIPSGGTYTGTGVSGGIFDPSVAGAGTHTITYTYADVNGCISTNNKTITVNPLPGNSGSVSGNSSLCQGSLNVSYSVTVIPNTLNYIWILTPASGGTVITSANSVIINWSVSYSGTAVLTVYGNNACGDGSTSPPYTIIVNPKPIVSYTICTDSVTTTNAKPILLKGGIPLGGTYTGTGVNLATGIFTPNVAGTGTHNISYTYNNTWGCTSFVNKTITVVNAPLFICGNALIDVRDNKSYRTINIGSQCWMAENLNYGTAMSSASNQRDNCVAEKYCYSNNSANCLTVGGLYEWNEIMSYSETPATQGLCPPSWHLPANIEWIALFSNYTNNAFAGSALKFTGFSGFDALLSGAEHFNLLFSYDNYAVFYWTSSIHGTYKAWAHGMNVFNPSVSYYPSNRSNAFHVRCIKD